MRRSWLNRATIALLLAGVLAGGAGAPVLDAVLYHRNGAAGDVQVTHFEPRGTRHNHGDECTLGWGCRVEPSESTKLPQVTLSSTALDAPPPRYAPVPRSLTPYSLQLPRAPPPLSA